MFHILMALVDRERHGYGIMQEIALRTDGAVRLGPGTLYRSIKALVESGMIEESAVRPDPSLDDERRRYYRITASGMQSAQDEARRLERLVELARDKRLLGAVGSA
jgi:DNA-binding PadR family transcriptional regulator